MSQLSTKISSIQLNTYHDELENLGIDKSIIEQIKEKTEEIVERGVVSSNFRISQSIQFKDKNGHYFRPSLSWKSVEEGISRGEDSDEMIELKKHFDEGKKKFGEKIKRKVELPSSGSVS